MNKRNTLTRPRRAAKADDAAPTVEQLRRSLKAAEKETFVYQSPDGSRALLLPYGARVLGLFPNESQHNFFWVNSALSASESARELFAKDGWQNTGGDRTWLDPEIDIFFPDYPRCQRHVEPATLDAADYSLDARDGGVALTRTMTLQFARIQRPIKLRLGKWIGPAMNPLRQEQDARKPLAAAQYAGYTQRTTLQLLGDAAKSPAPVGIWNLLQLPHGGDLIAPTYGPTKPRILFGDIPAECLVCDCHGVRFKINFPGEHKIAIRAAATTGRTGYLYASAGKWSLVVRNFAVDPSGQYVDVPKDQTDDFGYCVQAVNVDSTLGQFCEMEYHAPAIGVDAAAIRCEDVSQVWAFRGPQAAIHDLARRLLGPECIG